MSMGPGCNGKRECDGRPWERIGEADWDGGLLGTRNDEQGEAVWADDGISLDQFGSLGVAGSV